MAWHEDLKENVHTQFDLLGQRLGVNYEQSRSLPYLEGQFRGRNIAVKTILNYSDSDIKTYNHQLTVECKLPEGFTLILHREGLGDLFKKMLGMQDIQFGHKVFDDNFIIKSNNPKMAKSILNKPLRLQLIRDMGFIVRYDIGQRGWTFTRSRKVKKKGPDTQEILDIDIIRENQEKEARIKKKTHKPEKTIKTIFQNMVENNMKRIWLERLIDTTVRLAENIEKTQQKSFE